MLLIALVLFGSVIGINMFKEKKISEFLANMPEQEYPVTVTTAKATEWRPVIQAIGFIEPHQGVTVSSEQSGVIKKISFDSGQKVKAGQSLVTLDSDIEIANLQSSEANLPAAAAKYKRYKDLYQKGSVSQEDFDDAQASYLSLVAQIKSLKATIEQRNIKAPFSGVLGIRNVYLGQYVQSGTQIVQLEDTSVMRLVFTIPQNDISKVKVGQEVDISVDAYPNQIFKGAIKAIEPAVDEQSGLIKIQADIPNSDGKLLSGMFARANILLPEIPNQITLPQTAITYNLYGDNIYIVKDVDGVKRVKQEVVKVGERTGGIARVLSGVKPGDVIVTSGQVHLSNDSKVRVVESDATNPPAKTPML